MAMTLIEEVSVGAGGVAAIEFQAIPQDGQDLLCLFSFKATTAGADMILKLNNTTNSIVTVYGQGNTPTSNSSDRLGLAESNSPEANTFHILNLYVSNYTLARKHSFVSDLVVASNSSSNFASWQSITYGLSASTSPVTTLKLNPSPGLFAQHCTASLYSIS